MASQVESVKWVPGTPFLVDGFRFQSAACRAYFLSHAHSDHTTGLTPSFNSGPIYCTAITARILRHDFPGLRPGLLRALPLDQTHTICGVEVTALDANHCPGACMFLFRVPPPSGGGGRTQTTLHTGDFRWHDGMAEHPVLRGCQVDTLMLDTTYASPRWSFAPQADAVALLAATMAREAAAEPATLFVVGSYHIGKERAFLGAAAQLSWRVHCTPAKQKLLRLLGLPPEWLALLSDDPQAAPIHVLPMGEQLHEQALADRIQGTCWSRVVAIKPTGWSHRPKGGLEVRTAGCVTFVSVPYSEHSSFPELRACVKALRPRRLLPTVGAGDAAKSRALVDRFADLMDLAGDRSRLDAYLLPRRDARQQAAQEEQAKQQQAAQEEQQQAAVVTVGGSQFSGGEGGSQQQEQEPGGSGDGSTAMLCSAAGGSAWEDSSGGVAAAVKYSDAVCSLPWSAWQAPGGATAAAAGQPLPPAQIDTPVAQQEQQGKQRQQQQQQREQQGGEEIDLAAVDVAEQQRILAAIHTANHSRRSSGGSSSSRKRPPGSGGGGRGLKQPSLRRFFPPSQGSPD